MIRHADKNDIPKILEMSAKFWLRTQFDEPFNAEHTQAMVEMAISHGLLAVLVVDGSVNGFVAGIKSFLLGSQEAICATELAWWVEPEHRKGRNGVALVKFIENAAKEQGVKYWTMVSMQSSEPEQANSLYKALGYELSEESHTKRLV